MAKFGAYDYPSLETGGLRGKEKVIPNSPEPLGLRWGRAGFPQNVRALFPEETGVVSLPSPFSLPV